MPADDNEIERRQFMQKPVPAKPKVAGATSPMFEKLVPARHSVAEAEQDYVTNNQIALGNAFTAARDIMRTLRRYPEPLRKQIIEFIAESLLD